jgi:hypothetical protein
MRREPSSKPGRFPRFKHGMSFVGGKPLRDEDTFEVGGERIERAIESGKCKSGLIAEGSENAVAELRTAAFEENYVGNGFWMVLRSCKRSLRG